MGIKPLVIHMDNGWNSSISNLKHVLNFDKFASLKNVNFEWNSSDKNISITRKLDSAPLHEVSFVEDSTNNEKFGIKRPHGTPLVLSNRIVEDLKKELNVCREEKSIHSKVKELNKNLIPASHNKLEEWKSSFKGISFLHDSTNLLISS